MAVRLDMTISNSQVEAFNAIPATSWFTQFVFRNASSPSHPNPSLERNNEIKQVMVNDWIVGAVAGKRVLDLFSGNGGLSVVAALAGAKEVVGVEFSEERVRCAQLVARTVQPKLDGKLRFVQGDIYNIDDLFNEPFDVTLCLGGLYHIADPALILRKIAALTDERMILQTSHVLHFPGNWARFKVRRHDQTAIGMTSLRAGQGSWHFSAGCLRELLLHAGFEVTDERRPSIAKRWRFPWYAANCAVRLPI